MASTDPSVRQPVVDKRFAVDTSPMASLPASQVAEKSAGADPNYVEFKLDM